MATLPPPLRRAASQPSTPTQALSPGPNPNARRLSGGAQGRRLSGWRPEDVENFFDENDDEMERKKAAAEAEAAKAKKAQRSPFRATPGHERRKEIYKEQLQQCITMTNENKVNEKNSWSLDFIDHMRHMLDDKEGPKEGGPNFQMASTTLDAGVKIYSYRVDSVFTQTYKLITNINRTGRGKDGDADGIAEEEEDLDEDHKENDESSIVVIDDWASSLKNHQIANQLNHIFANARHLNVVIFVLVQTFRFLPDKLRKMASDVVLVGKPKNKQEMKALGEEIFYKEPKEITRLFDYAFKRKHDFIWVKDDAIYRNFRELEIEGW